MQTFINTIFRLRRRSLLLLFIPVITVLLIKAMPRDTCKSIPADEFNNTRGLLSSVPSQAMSPAPKSGMQTCTPQTNIVFLRVHKAGSSAVQNIILRHGWLQDLKFALKHQTWPNTFDRKMVDKSLHPNILCQHIVYNRRELEAVMPRDSKYVTILRDPGTQLESWYMYYGFQRKYGADFESFLSDPYLHAYNMVHPKDLRQAYYIGPMRNIQLFDLGLVSVRVRHPGHTAQNRIERYIQIIERDFHLVMIHELFLESLILLKDLMCWTLSDVVTFSKNERMHTFREKEEVVMKTASIARRWSSADTAVHHYFFQKLKQKIHEYGEDQMQREVHQLKEMTSQTYHACVESTVNRSSQHDIRFKAQSPKVHGYVLRNHMAQNKTCQALLFSAPGFRKVMRPTIPTKIQASSD